MHLGRSRMQTRKIRRWNATANENKSFVIGFLCWILYLMRACLCRHAVVAFLSSWTESNGDCEHLNGRNGMEEEKTNYFERKKKIKRSEMSRVRGTYAPFNGRQRWRPTRDWTQIAILIVATEFPTDQKRNSCCAHTQNGRECDSINLLLQEVKLRDAKFLDFLFIKY